MFSIIIPTHNRADLVHECMQISLNNTGLPRNEYEIIHIDDGSTGNEVAHVMQQFLPDIQILKKYNDGTVKTKNLGIASARGDWVVIMDSDFQMSPNWLKTTKQYAENFSGLHVICYSDHMRDKWADQTITQTGLQLIKMKVPLVSGAFAFSRHVIQKVGYLDQAFGFYGLNDAEWTRRVLKAELLFGYVPSIIGKHMGGTGEPGKNREKKDESLKKNGSIFNIKSKLPRIFYNPHLTPELNRVCDEYIRKI